jgi:hypothetical protein
MLSYCSYSCAHASIFVHIYICMLYICISRIFLHINVYVYICILTSYYIHLPTWIAVEEELSQQLQVQAKEPVALPGVAAVGGGGLGGNLLYKCFEFLCSLLMSSAGFMCIT